MRCAFEGGNLDGSFLDVDEDEMSPFRGHLTCSPGQSAEQIRSHGRCVYVRTERAVERDGTSWVVFAHHGDWTNYESIRSSPVSDDRS